MAYLPYILTSEALQKTKGTKKNKNNIVPSTWISLVERYQTKYHQPHITTGNCFTYLKYQVFMFFEKRYAYAVFYVAIGITVCTNQMPHRILQNLTGKPKKISYGQKS